MVLRLSESHNQVTPVRVNAKNDASSPACLPMKYSDIRTGLLGGRLVVVFCGLLDFLQLGF